MPSRSALLVLIIISLTARQALLTYKGYLYEGPKSSGALSFVTVLPLLCDGDLHDVVVASLSLDHM